MIKRSALFGAECREEIVFDQSESEKSNGEFFLACRGEFDDVTSSVCWIATPDNQTPLLKFIQKSNNVARVEAQCLAEDLLAQRSALVQESEGVEVPGPKPAGRH